MSNTIPNAPEQFDPAGSMRLFPTVSFATRAAALSMVGLPVAILAASVLAGTPDAVADTLGSTCCPPVNH
ncbi:hypothetical protein [Actinocrispum sp. NPDC049592]|uniref:hypothetical protein n=1 Tax=Actinocrispum sp. NPDC049592 TaxID=3154835 RepID=UPI00343A7C1F